MPEPFSKNPSVEEFNNGTGIMWLDQNQNRVSISFPETGKETRVILLGIYRGAVENN